MNELREEKNRNIQILQPQLILKATAPGTCGSQEGGILPLSVSPVPTPERRGEERLPLTTAPGFVRRSRGAAA